MRKVNENIATNITKLRKLNKLTQSDLACKLSYSDKAISKWERGDSIPDIETLCEIASLFNVSIDYLTQEHDDKDLANTCKNRKLFARNLLITIMLCVSAILISTVIFSYAVIKDKTNTSTYWTSFIAATPLCSLIVYFYAKKENYWLAKLISLSLFAWTAITTTFCFALVNGSTELWLLYIIGLPIQAAICLFYFWKKTF